MNPKIKQDWIERLRSGLYAQGQRRLRRDTISEPKHCCLGVLCELAVEAGVISPSIVYGSSDVTAYGHEPYFLPKQVQEWAGIADEECSLYGGDFAHQKSLSYMN